jgi:regulator of replication initiation timing
MYFDPSMIEELKSKILALTHVHSALSEKHRSLLSEAEGLKHEIRTKSEEVSELRRELALLRGQLNEKQGLEKSQAETKKFIGEMLSEISRYLEESKPDIA